ncbi:MAG: ComEC/Rec2 family competence protein [Alphaproteobacteria bacterium]
MTQIALYPFLFGLGIGIYFALPFEPNLWITLVVIELIIFLAIIWRYYRGRLIILGYISLVVLGFANIQLKSNYLSYNKITNKEDVIYLKGNIDFKDFNIKGNPRYTLTNITDFDDEPIFNKIRVSAMFSSFNVGQCIEMVANIMPPFSPPFYGAYDFSRKAFYNSLQANGFSTTRAYEIECEKNKLYIISNIREKIMDKINKYVPKSEAGIVTALIAGEKGKILQQQKENYRNSGLAHILSISGMHISMIAGLMFLLVRTLLVFIPNFALKYDTKKISAITAMLFATFYLLISGMQIPTQRAYIMVFIMLLGILFDRKAISIRTISIAAMIILAISPESLVSPSFQMSFAAVLCMIAFYEKFATQTNNFIKKFGFIISYILGLIIADLIASVATLPFAIYHFNNVAAYTSLANMLAGPIIGIIVMPFILISLISMPFGLEALPLKVLSYGVSLINDITSFVSSLNGATLHLLSMPTWAFVSIILGGLFLCLWQSKIRLYGIAPIIIGFLSLCFVEKPIAINLDNPSKFEKMLVIQKYGDIKIKNEEPYGAVVYKNKTKKLKFNRIWDKKNLL